jgi:superfamily II DNA or RNA helicase
MIPRPYQIAARDQAWAKAGTRPALVVLPTGTGKTLTEVLCAEKARERSNKPVLWIAHRAELLAQAAHTFRSFKWWVFIEQANQRAKPFQVRTAALQFPTVLCASVGTLQGQRLTRWRPDDFAVVLVDEAHHGPAKSWRKIVEYWECPVIGFTGTPQRATLDEHFELAYAMSLSEAIADGWLVPISGYSVIPDGWDMSQFTKPRGAQDINKDELATMVDGHLSDAVAALRSKMGGQQTLSFWPSVLSAEGCAKLLAADGVSSCWVSGRSTKENREHSITAFRKEQIQALSNCAVLTEGFDAPCTRVLALARPTRSEVLYTQMLGRGLRPLPGVIDGLDSAAERCAAIEQSAKSHVVVLDYQGSGANFDIMNLTLVFGSGHSFEIQERAKQLLQRDTQDLRRVFERAEAELEQEQLEAEARERRAAELAYAEAVALEREAAQFRAALAQGSRYQFSSAPWLDPSTANRLASREEESQASENPATVAQRKAIFALLKEAVAKAGADGRLPGAVWRASESWSRRAASKEITFLQRRFGLKLKS